MSESKPLPRLPLSGEELKPISPSANSPLPRGAAGVELNKNQPSQDKESFAGICLSPSLDKGRAGEGFGIASAAPDSAFLPYNKNFTDRAREHRKNPTKPESKIWNEVLRMRQFAEYKFLRQKPIDNYIVDFYCSKLRLVIEIDGDSHAETVEYDAERTRVLQSLGLTVVRYTNDDVIQNIQGVYDDLSQRIERLTQSKPLPRLPLSGEEPKSCLSPSLDKGRAGEGFDGGGCR